MADKVCGTGLWGNATKPGDPDNNSILTATPAFGGIDVEWTWPNTNPEGVAHVRLYRSTSGDPNTAVLHKIVLGNFYYDRIQYQAITYYYWIEIVSVNGTIGDMIGPVSAQARPLILDTLELLTDSIDSGVLAQSLKDEIARIQTNKLEIDAEVLARAASDESLGASITQIQGRMGDVEALIQEEQLARAEADSAFVSTVNTLYTTINDDIMAALQVEQQARVDADEALSSQITTAEAQLGEDLAQVQQTIETTVNAQLEEIGALYTAQLTVNNLVGGFGVYNDGTTVEAGFDVDRFWVGRTGADKIKPFIIDDDEVFIKEAVIQSLTFSKLRDESGSFIVSNGKIKGDYIEAGNLHVAGAATFTGNAQSSNFPGGGWRLMSNGTFNLRSSSSGARLDIAGDQINVYDGSRLRVRLGRL